MTRVLLTPARPVIDDTFLEGPMPDARFDRRYLPLDGPGTGIPRPLLAICLAGGIAGWALIAWVL